MAAVKVVLLTNYPQLGFVGDVVRVKPGYARNWLIPQGIAALVRDRQARVVEHLMKGVNARKNRLRSEAQDLAKKVGECKLEFSLQVGSSGKVFGSVTIRDLEAKLRDAGFRLDRRQIRLLEPLRTIGEHQVEVKLHPEVKTSVSITIKDEHAEKKAQAAAAAEAAAEDKGADEAAPKKGGRRRKSEDESSAA